MYWARVRFAAAAALGAGLLVGSLAVTPAAGAAITASSISTPTSPSFFIADEDAATQTFAVAGTTSGGTPATDKIDIRCYYGSTYVTVAGNVSLQSNGSFSVPNANLNTVVNHTCRLRAVPAGSNPSSLTPFSGPLVGVGERVSRKVASGPNSGKTYDYYIDAQQQTAAFDYLSVGGCGIDDGYLLDATYARTTTTFYCNAGLFKFEDQFNPTRSELQIDGANAYVSYWPFNINPSATGLPSVSYSYSVDAHTGDLVIHETDPIVKCPDATYPPTATSCPSFISTGVTDTRTITQDHDGHISWISDVFSSTDNKGHAVDLLWDNNQKFSNPPQIEYEFPGQSAYATHAAGDTISLPSSPGTILIRVYGAADGDTATGQGAIVYDRPATSAKFTFVGGDSEFYLHQAGTVPAGGSTRFRFAYVQDYHAATVASLAQTASTAFLNTLSVTRSGTGKGTVSSSPAGISCGTTCSHRYPGGTSVILKATPAKGSTLARWSGACTGTGTCTVTTNDNATVNATFVLRPCVVPNLKGKTLKAAKRAIKNAFCSIGKVRMVASSKVRKGHVISQKPKPHKRLKHHAKVYLVVSTG